jgi:hypothetical protein
MMVEHRAIDGVIHASLHAFSLGSERFRNGEIELPTTEVQSQRMIELGDIQGQEDGRLPLVCQTASNLVTVDFLDRSESSSFCLIA